MPESQQRHRAGNTRWRIEVGDCREVLAALPAESVQTVVTSPPYFGLRDYGTGEWVGGDAACDHREGHQTGRVTPASKNGMDVANVTRWSTCGRCGAVREDRQIGLEATPEEFVDALVAVFREVRRVLRSDGTLWLNLGDSYATRWSSRRSDGGRAGLAPGVDRARHHAPPAGYKNKDLIGIPWMVAFALRADGWYLRSEIVWAKPNPMPESVTDRPTRAHEQIFLLTKRPSYYFDAQAIREPAVSPFDDGATWEERKAAGATWGNVENPKSGGGTQRAVLGAGVSAHLGDGRTRNRRDVWTVATRPFADAHFATFPPDLIEPCVLAGAPRGGVVLDPFAGAGTTGLVAVRAGREFVGVELNPDYAALARERIETDIRLGHRPPQRAVAAAPGALDLFTAAEGEADGSLVA